jgi:hypothetical protein
MTAFRILKLQCNVLRKCIFYTCMLLCGLVSVLYYNCKRSSFMRVIKFANQKNPGGTRDLLRSVVIYGWLGPWYHSHHQRRPFEWVVRCWGKETLSFFFLFFFLFFLSTGFPLGWKKKDSVSLPQHRTTHSKGRRWWCEWYQGPNQPYITTERNKSLVFNRLPCFLYL